VNLVHELSPKVGVVAACAALGVSRATLYRRRVLPRPELPRRELSPRGLSPAATSDSHTADATPAAVPSPAADSAAAPTVLSLSGQERRVVLDTLLCERFMDQSPYQIWATLLDEGSYLCSVRTMYRLLGQQDLVRERRRQRRHPHYKKPELLATAPNQVWSWDITKLKGPATWNYYCLYVILDIYSRYVVGWMVAEQESQHLAQRLIEQTLLKQAIAPGQLTIHADRGAAMTSKPVALLLSDLGVLKTHSRPHVSNDNPYSEAQFKTLKYCPQFPERFGSLADARSFGAGFFDWYNRRHHHSGIALLTPETVHYGRAQAVLAARQAVLQQAYAAHPERFRGRVPRPLALPPAVWINPPAPNELPGECSQAAAAASN